MITCFKIFKHQDNYIVHGELSITCLDKNGHLVWQQSGRDIFVVMDDEPNFSLGKGYIMVRDFNNETYKFDYEGNIIEDERV